MKRHNQTSHIAKLLAVIMLAALCISPALATSISKTGDTGIWFSPYDFTSVLDDSDRQLAGIVVATLPETGTLTYAGRELYEGEAVTVDTLGALAYVPAQDGGRYVSFGILPVYADGFVAEAMTVSLTMQSVDNHPPMAQDIEIKTMKNVAVTGMFRAVDPEGDALTFRITSKPRRGEVEVTSDGRFIYTPFHNKTGKDSMTYVAVDAYGNVSSEAKINVIIEKPAAKKTYADMDGHPAQYAALRLSGEDVYTGQQMCGNYYFGPDEIVSRAEMITMIVKALGMDVVPVTVTGFYDDDVLPDWFKPYAQAALKAGIISGVRSPDGRTVLNASEPVTLSQAATMLNKAIRPAAAPLAELDAVPAWSAQAISNLDAAGILDDVSVSSGDRALTRAEVAMLLVRTMDAFSITTEKSGLLSWVFGW